MQLSIFSKNNSCQPLKQSTNATPLRDASFKGASQKDDDKVVLNSLTSDVFNSKDIKEVKNNEADPLLPDKNDKNIGPKYAFLLRFAALEKQRGDYYQTQYEALKSGKSITA